MTAKKTPVKKAKAKPSKLVQTLKSAATLAKKIAKHEASRAKKAAAAAVKREAKRQVKSVKRQALAFIGIKPKRKKVTQGVPAK